MYLHQLNLSYAFNDIPKIFINNTKHFNIGGRKKLNKIIDRLFNNNVKTKRSDPTSLN